MVAGDDGAVGGSELDAEIAKSLDLGCDEPFSDIPATGRDRCCHARNRRSIALGADHERHPEPLVEQATNQLNEVRDVAIGSSCTRDCIVGPSAVRHHADGDTSSRMRRHPDPQPGVGKDDVGSESARRAQFGHVRLRTDVAVAPMCRQPRRPDHQATAPRVLDGSGPDPDERERRPRQPRAERPTEQDVRYALRAESEIVEHAGAGNEHQRERSDTAVGVDPANRLAEWTEERALATGFRNRPRREGSRLVHLDRTKTIGVGDVARRGRDADRLDVRCQLLEHLQPDLERSVVAEVADAEQAEQPDHRWFPAAHRPCVPLATTRSPPRKHRHRRHATWCKNKGFATAEAAVGSADCAYVGIRVDCSSATGVHLEVQMVGRGVAGRTDIADDLATGH